MSYFACTCGVPAFDVVAEDLPICCDCNAVAESLSSPLIHAGDVPTRRRKTRRRPLSSCRHRGGELREQVCQTCAGSVRLKVFQCALHGECTTHKALPGVPCCTTCDDAPKFVRAAGDDRPAVGFLAVCFAPIGGTETWHRLLLPRLQQVAVLGFVSTWLYGGDTSGLGCPVGHGIEAARELASSVDVLVEWGVRDLASVLPTRRRPRVVSVHHGDTQSQWSRNMIRERLSIADVVACVNADVAGQLRSQGVTAVHLPNAVESPPDSLVSHAKLEKGPFLTPYLHAGGRVPTTNSPRASHMTPAAGHASRDPAAEFGGVGSRRVLWLGRFSSEKRPVLAVEIARTMPDVEFRFVGAGAELDAMRAESRGAPNVSIAPAVPSPWEELASAACFLSTSDQEGFGLSIAEAMLAGVPVVSTPCGVAATAGLCQQVAIDAPIGDWVRAIEETLATPDAKQIGAARAWIERAHNPANVVAQWERLLGGLA